MNPEALEQGETGELVERLARSLRAGQRALALVTEEERRAERLLEAVGARLTWGVHVWSAAAGVDGTGDDRDLGLLLEDLYRRRETGLWVLQDATEALATAPPAARRIVRELAQRSWGPAIVLVSPRLGPLARIPELAVEPLPLPGPEELQLQVAWIGELLEQRGQAGAAALLEAAAPRIAQASLGLGLDALDRLVAEAVLAEGVQPDAILAYITHHKARQVARSALLESVDPVPLDEVGGLEPYKLWLRRRALALEPGARHAGIPAPRGALLVGVQGCGKSLAARATASALDLPLLRLELGRVFGGTVGESESNMRQVIEIADRLAPAVLWIDEIDKGLAGIEGAASDAGTTARVVGSLLTWLQERDRPLFVVATANRVDRLPPELLRRGRLDELFFVDLPDAAARESILEVHLIDRPARLLGEAPPMADDFEDFATVVREAEGFSGAEIEAAVVEARLEAYARWESVAARDLEAALRSTVPLSKTRAESVAALRAWAHDRARKA